MRSSGSSLIFNFCCIFPKLYNKNRICLILDLDETLVHSSFSRPEGKADIIMPITIGQQIREIYVLKRPFADKFLKRTCELFEVIIYTASLEKYAAPLMEILDPEHLTAARLYRHHCSFY